MKQVVVAMTGVAALLALGACQKKSPPSECDAAIGALVEKIDRVWNKSGAPLTPEERAAAKQLGEKAAQRCAADKWSPDALRCLRASESREEQEKCWDLLTEEQRSRYFEALGMTPQSKADQAKNELTRLSQEAFPLWSLANPDAACPANLDALLAYVAFTGDDPWGHRYRLFCGATLPAGAKDLAASSDGPDGKPDTADDVRSWR